MVTMGTYLLIIVFAGIVIWKYGDPVSTFIMKVLRIKDDSKRDPEESEKSMLQKKQEKLKELRRVLRDMETEQDVTLQLKQVEDDLDKVVSRIEEIDASRS